MMSPASLLKAAARPLVDYALPPRCPGCGAIVAEDHAFCLDCWGGMTFLGDPCCARCGVPFPHDLGSGAECGPCMTNPPPWDSARAVLAYGDVARTVALRLKYGRRVGLARLVATHMVRHVDASHSSADAPLIMPVPLHRWRLWQRGFNQSALIADHLGRLTGLTVDKEALVRTRRTAPLRGMGGAARARMVKGAFAVRGTKKVAGRSIILVDDILTSGATAAACTRALRAAGAGRVHLLCWARVLPGDADD